jgi:dipeptidyl aminopeptidase/acylaminoacyl peptidase
VPLSSANVTTSSRTSATLLARLTACALLLACASRPAEPSPAPAPASPPAAAPAVGPGVAPAVAPASASQAASPAGVAAAAPAPAASPAGELLLAEGAPSDWTLLVLDAGTGLARALPAPRGATEPAWSPDGERIAFRARRDGGWTLGTMLADGSDLRWHAPGLSVAGACWTQDSQAVLVGGEPVAADAGASGTAASGTGAAAATSIWLVPIAPGAEPEALVEGHSPVLSPGGMWLLVERTTDRSELHVLHRPSGSFAPLTTATMFTGAAFTRDHLYLGRQHLSGVWQIIGTPWPVLHWKRETTGLTDSLPTPAPDGRTLAFVRATPEDAGDGGREELWMLDVATRAERSVPLEPARTPGESGIHGLAWSPDGTRLAATVGGGELTAARRLLLLDVASGAVSVLRAPGDAPGGERGGERGGAQIAWLTWRPRPGPVPLPPPRASEPAPR